MDNTVDIRAEHLRAVASTVADLRALVQRTVAYRDSLMRDMRHEGYSAIKIAELAGVTRALVYGVLEGLTPGAEDADYADVQERLDDAWQVAVDEWEAADYRGIPDDYFPLEALLAHR